MSTKLKLVARVGEYTNQAGETKGKYTTLGVIFLDEKGGGYALIDPGISLAGIHAKQKHLSPEKTRDSVMFNLYPDDPPEKIRGATYIKPPSQDSAPVTDLDDAILF